MDAALATSRCLVAMITRSYFQSADCQRHWQTFMVRQGRMARKLDPIIIPVVLHGGETLPNEARRIQHFDFSSYFVVGEGFRKTEAYVAFQQEMKKLAETVARRIEQALPFDPEFTRVQPEIGAASEAPQTRSVDR